MIDAEQNVKLITKKIDHTFNHLMLYYKYMVALLMSEKIDVNVKVGSTFR